MRTDNISPWYIGVHIFVILQLVNSIPTDNIQSPPYNDEKYCILHWLAVLLENREFETSSALAAEAKQYILEHFRVDYERAEHSSTAEYLTYVAAINQHLKTIFNDGELERNSVIKKYLITADDGKNYNIHQKRNFRNIAEVKNYFCKKFMENSRVFRQID